MPSSHLAREVGDPACLFSKRRRFTTIAGVRVVVLAATLFFIIFCSPRPFSSSSSSSSSWISSDNQPPNATAAITCLQKTTPTLHPDQFPVRSLSSARQHFTEIHQALSPWIRNVQQHCAADYCGPWIENVWIDTFGQEHAHASWGPYIPLVIPWTDLWLQAGFQYPTDFIDTLVSLLRSDRLYVTVSQNDEGIVGKNEWPGGLPPNLLVLSAGGYGHVPIPLLKQDEPLLRLRHGEQRTWEASYVGSLTHAPQNLRQCMHEALWNNHTSSVHYTHYHGPLWRNVMRDSYLQLAPRGYGRTSYHLMEILQQGRVPVQVYLDTPWVPYQTLFEKKWGYLTDVDGITQVVRTAAQAHDHAMWQRREARIASYRYSHFSMAGVMEQIRLFLVDPPQSDLECIALPATVRAADGSE